jgi:HAD superfamily hydrolase (TIGR01549 family)
MIETVFFDFGGTLAFEPYPHADSLHQFLVNRGIPTNREEVEAGECAMRAFEEVWMREHGGCRSKRLADRYWFNVCLAFARHIRSVKDSQDLAELLHASHQIIPYRLYDDAIPALNALAQCGFRMGIISNWDAPTLEFATRDSGIRSHFVMVLSSRCAECEKPDPTIFWEALRRANARPQTAVHIGDSIAADIAGARAAEIAPIWINRHNASDDPGCPIVQDLAQLPDLLAQL